MSKTLEQRAVACKGWRWMPGMRVANDDPETGDMRVVSVNGDEAVTWLPRWGGSVTTSTSAMLPDLTDAATLGCLRAMVLDAYRETHEYVTVTISVDESDSARVGIYVGAGESYHYRGKSLAEALVAALEGAP